MPGRRRIGRRHCQHRLNDGRHALEHLFIFGIVRRVLLAELRDLAQIGVFIRAEKQVSAVQKGRERRRIALHGGEAIVGQAQVPDDFRPKQTVDIGGRRHLEAGKRLLGDAGTTDDIAAFQDKHLPFSFGKVASRDQAIVSAANDDCVVMSHDD